MISPATAGPVARSWIDLEALFFAHGSRPPSCSCVWSRRCSFRLAACRRHGLSRPNSPSTRHQEAATSPYLLPGSRSGAERDSRVRRRSRGAAAAAARYGLTCWTWAASASSSGRLSPALPISQEPRSWSPSPPSEEPHPIPRRISVAGEELSNRDSRDLGSTVPLRQACSCSWWRTAPPLGEKRKRRWRGGDQRRRRRIDELDKEAS